MRAGFVKSQLRFCDCSPSEMLWVEAARKPRALARRCLVIARCADVRVARCVGRKSGASLASWPCERVTAASARPSPFSQRRAAHHRLLWIHLSRAANGRVTRLTFALACCWMLIGTARVLFVARGLARHVGEIGHLAECDFRAEMTSTVEVIFAAKKRLRPSLVFFSKWRSTRSSSWKSLCSPTGCARESKCGLKKRSGSTNCRLKRAMFSKRCCIAGIFRAPILPVCWEAHQGMRVASFLRCSIGACSRLRAYTSL